MTDEIIIDGVDVSWCDFLSKEDDYCSYSGEYRAYKGQCGCSDEEMCKDHPNCFYKKVLKQLKRKEQECEKINLTNERLVAEKYNMNKEILKYIQALDEIENLCRNEACSPCKELEENDYCDECHNKIILDIVNKAKEK